MIPHIQANKYANPLPNSYMATTFQLISLVPQQYMYEYEYE